MGTELMGPDNSATPWSLTSPKKNQPDNIRLHSVRRFILTVLPPSGAAFQCELFVIRQQRTKGEANLEQANKQTNKQEPPAFPSKRPHFIFASSSLPLPLIVPRV